MTTAGRSEIVFVIEDDPDGGLVADALGHAIVTQADDYARLKHNIRDAVQCHFEAGARPAMIQLHYIRDEIIAA